MTTENNALVGRCKAIVKKGEKIVYKEPVDTMREAFEIACGFCAEIDSETMEEALANDGLVGHNGSDKVYIK